MLLVESMVCDLRSIARIRDHIVVCGPVPVVDHSLERFHEGRLQDLADCADLKFDHAVQLDWTEREGIKI